MFFAYTTYLTIYAFVSNNSSFVYYEKDILKLSCFLFLIFLYTSYEFFCLDETIKTRECLVAYAQNKRYKSYQFICLIVLAFIYFFTAFLFVSIEYLVCFSGNPISHLTRIFIDCFLNIFLVLFSSVFISLVVSTITKRLLAYVTLLGISIITFPYFSNLFSNSKIFNFLELFNLNLYLDFMPNHGFGFSFLPYRWLKHIIWWLICILILVIKYKTEVYHTTKKIFSILTVTILISSFFVYFMPSSKVDMNEYYQLNELEYYTQNKQTNQTSQFNITECQMNLEIKRQLKATVTVTIDDTSHEKYIFTLYHGYIIDEVLDKNYKPLYFKQDSDYITVYKNTLSDISQITFKYEGSCPTFYSNYQGTYLSGAFPYYPKAGWHNVYYTDYQAYDYVVPDNQIDFFVSVNSSENTFSNLSRDDDGNFVGRSNAATIISGLYDEILFRGIHIIYPYLAKELVTDTAIENEITKIITSPYFKNDTLNTIICIPNMNNREYFPTYGGCIEVVSIKQAYDVYTMSIVPDDKKVIYYLFNVYTNYGNVSESLSESQQIIIEKIESVLQSKNNASRELQDYIFHNKNSEKYDKIFELK